MDLIKTEEQFEPQHESYMPKPLQGMLGLPLVRQVGLLVGLAASIALGVAVALWSQTPDYTILYSNLSGQDTSQMVNVLQQYDIDYRLDPDSGALLVDASKVHEAKLKLAAENLINPHGQGFELIDKDQGFGSSAFIQSARYQHAQEVELARTITSIASVQSARVHLALPKESAFIRNRRKPSASVMVKLMPGRKLEKEQVTAIVNLVAASIPNMESSDVTLIDNKGRLLSSSMQDGALALTTTQFEYTQKVEQAYIDRIENILAPLVGIGGVRAQVKADIDFTSSESTSESFNPDLPAIRSEQQFEEQTKGNVLQGGIPGALSNQPPGQATAPERAGNTVEETSQSKQPSKTRKRVTRNYELDKTINHTRRSPGTIRKLSVAVVLDIKKITDKDGKVSLKPYSEEELAKFTSLVKETVGFNTMRGDTVKVINAGFTVPEIQEIPEESFWEKSWFRSVAKQVVGGMLVLLLLFGVLRPVMNKLANHSAAARNVESDGLSEDQLTLTGGEGVGRLPKPTTYEDNLNMAKQMATSEPKRVAQVVKGWLDDSK